MKKIKLSLVILFTLFLTACGVMNSKPVPPPAPSSHAQEIRRDQTQGLQRMGTVTSLVRGSPDDAVDEVKAKAAAPKADYYVIVLVDETIVTGQWYSQAILYRK